MLEIYLPLLLILISGCATEHADNTRLIRAALEGNVEQVNAPPPPEQTQRSPDGVFGTDPCFPVHFVYRDKPFFFVGKSAFALIDAEWKTYVDEACRDGFTVLRVWLCCPSLTKKYGTDHFHRNQAAGELWPFGGTPEQPDFGRLNEDYFSRLDRMLNYLHAKEMIVELTLFTGGDYWPGGPLAWDDIKKGYVRFVIGRYMAQPNLYYEIANEYYAPEQQAFVEQAGDFIWEHDRVHLVTASGCDVARLAKKPWYRLHNIHASRGQNWWLRAHDEVFQFVRIYPFPIVNDEPTGSLAPEDQEQGYPGRDTDSAHHRMNFWTTAMAGGHVTFHSHKGINALAGYSPGQEFVKPFREFFRQVQFRKMKPAPEVVTSGTGFAIESASEIVVYLLEGGNAKLNLTTFKGTLTANWFNPRDGKSGKRFKVAGGHEAVFTAPDRNDWVLQLRKSHTPKG
jgi:hypothetical protein